MTTKPSTTDPGVGADDWEPPPNRAMREDLAALRHRLKRADPRVRKHLIGVLIDAELAWIRNTVRGIDNRDAPKAQALLITGRQLKEAKIRLGLLMTDARKQTHSRYPLPKRSGGGTSGSPG